MWTLCACFFGLLAIAPIGAVYVHSEMEQAFMSAEKRTLKLFEEAFGTAHQGNCPYGDKEAGKKGTTESFSCHWRSTGGGNSCPKLQKDRLKVAHASLRKKTPEVLQSAKTFGEIHKLYDKSSKIDGHEDYEELMRMQIDGLMDESVVVTEDKIKFKEVLDGIGVVHTDLYFGAHKSDWNRQAFATALTNLCSSQDGFLIKPTHLAWSAGIKIVRNWKTTCNNPQEFNEKVAELTDFVEKEAIYKDPLPSDAHLNFLENGVMIEELFQTGGHSKVPLEVKVQTLFGEAIQSYIYGEDMRGCYANSAAWTYYPDGTGWDLGGMVGPGFGVADSEGAKVLAVMPQLVAMSKQVATAFQADYMRVDLFVSWAAGGAPLIKVNEVESVSGSPMWWERQPIAQAWVDGYLLSDRLSGYTTEKWENLWMVVHHSRCTNGLDVCEDPEEWWTWIEDERFPRMKQYWRNPATPHLYNEDIGAAQAGLSQNSLGAAHAGLSQNSPELPKSTSINIELPISADHIKQMIKKFGTNFGAI